MIKIHNEFKVGDVVRVINRAPEATIVDIQVKIISREQNEVLRPSVVYWVHIKNKDYSFSYERCLGCELESLDVPQRRDPVTARCGLCGSHDVQDIDISTPVLTARLYQCNDCNSTTHVSTA